MTQQQIADYKTVQSLDILELWTQWDGRYKGKSLEELPLKCAISDMEMIVLDGETELVWTSDRKDRKELQTRISKAKAFLRKYNK